MVLCLCGCGQETKPCMVTNKGLGFVKGEPNKYIKGHNRPWLGKTRPPCSNEYREKQRLVHLGKKHNMTEEGRAQSRENIKKAHTKEAILKMSNTLRGRILAKEHIRKSRISGRPTRVEKAMIKILSELRLPYRYTGDGAVRIDRLNPDFVNINGEKIALEVYAKIYKEIDGRDIKRWKETRNKRFAKYGWTIFYFDESQINIDYVKSVLGGDSY